MTIGHFQSTINAMSSGGWSLSNLATSYVDTAAATTTYTVDMVFRTDGTVDVLRPRIPSDLLNEQDPYVSPTSEASNTWVRCTYNSGDTMTGGDTLGTWHRLNTERRFTMTKVSTGGNDEFSGNFDFELSSDASGSPIRAQALSVTINVGETA